MLFYLRCSMSFFYAGSAHIHLSVKKIHPNAESAFVNSVYRPHTCQFHTCACKFPFWEPLSVQHMLFRLHCQVLDPASCLMLFCCEFSLASFLQMIHIHSLSLSKGKRRQTQRFHASYLMHTFPHFLPIIPWCFNPSTQIWRCQLMRSARLLSEYLWPSPPSSCFTPTVFCTPLLQPSR